MVKCFLPNNVAETFPVLTRWTAHTSTGRADHPSHTEIPGPLNEPGKVGTTAPMLGYVSFAHRAQCCTPDPWPPGVLGPKRPSLPASPLLLSYCLVIISETRLNADRAPFFWLASLRLAVARDWARPEAGAQSSTLGVAEIQALCRDLLPPGVPPRRRLELGLVPDLEPRTTLGVRWGLPTLTAGPTPAAPPQRFKGA